MATRRTAPPRHACALPSFLVPDGARRRPLPPFGPADLALVAQAVAEGRVTQCPPGVHDGWRPSYCRGFLV